MSVVFPIATLMSVLACIAEVPHRHPPFSFEVNFFLFYMVSQVIPNSRFLHVRNQLSLAFTNTHIILFLRAQTVTPSMFDISFSIPSHKARLCQWVISKFRATVFTHPHWEPKQQHLPAAFVSLAATFTSTLQRCYGSTTWLGLSCTVLGCMFSWPENKACVYVQLTVPFHGSLVVM